MKKKMVELGKSNTDPAEMRKGDKYNLRRLGISAFITVKDNMENSTSVTLKLTRITNSVLRGVGLRDYATFEKGGVKGKSRLAPVTRTRLATDTNRSLKSVDLKSFLSDQIFILKWCPKNLT